MQPCVLNSDAASSSAPQSAFMPSRLNDLAHSSSTIATLSSRSSPDVMSFVTSAIIDAADEYLSGLIHGIPPSLLGSWQNWLPPPMTNRARDIKMNSTNARCGSDRPNGWSMVRPSRTRPAYFLDNSPIALSSSERSSDLPMALCSLCTRYRHPVAHTDWQNLLGFLLSENFSADDDSNEIRSPRRTWTAVASLIVMLLSKFRTVTALRHSMQVSKSTAMSASCRAATSSGQIIGVVWLYRIIKFSEFACSIVGLYCLSLSNTATNSANAAYRG